MTSAATPAAPHSIVFGPFRTRHLGIALGINAAPSLREDCGPECLFCQNAAADAVPVLSRANQMPSAGVIVTSAARRIIELSKAGDKLDTIALMGNGEPTRHPDLQEISENLRDLRNKWFAKADLVLLSDTPDPDAPSVRHVLGIYDRVVLRLEWGTAKTFAAMTGRPGTDLKRLVELGRTLDKLVLQACFVAGKNSNASESEVRNWIKKIEEARPREVLVGTLEGTAKRGAAVKPLTATQLEKIAAEVHEKTGIQATVIAGEAQAV